MFDILSLPWLRKKPDDFSNSIRSLKQSIDDKIEYTKILKRLSTYSLDSATLLQLANKVEPIINESGKLLTPVRLAIVSNSTSNYISQAIKATGLRYNLRIKGSESDYDQVMQQVLDPDSDLYKFDPDIVLLQLDYRGLPLRTACDSLTFNSENLLEDSINYVKMIAENIQSHCSASLILQTLAAPLKSVFGHPDSTFEMGFLKLINNFNKQLSSLTSSAGIYILDVANMASLVGYARWFDETQWYFARLPFAQDCIPFYADHVCRVVSAIKGTSRKVLVLDLDNTLWGGVIGDDGINGISLGSGDAIGEAFLAVQQMAKLLRDRGVILAINSKNNEEVAREAFSKHPEMILKESDISVFQANWIDKATNIEAIASTLNLGLDSIVFMDDNPAEREQVRQALPDVAVLELPEDTALYSTILAQCGYFETVAFSAEDTERTAMYQSNMKRLELQNSAFSLDDYLKSLDMVIKFSDFNESSRGRISQLINKSNQFNLTTKRYTEQQVFSFENDPTIFTLQVRLEDRFGDNGMISVIICKAFQDEPHTWLIDTWLMSCRVLGRTVERAVLNYLVENAKTFGVDTIRGEYIPTEKNQLVKDHYKKLGFTLLEEVGQNTTWKLHVQSYTPFIIPMKVIDTNLMKKVA